MVFISECYYFLVWFINLCLIVLIWIWLFVEICLGIWIVKFVVKCVGFECVLVEVFLIEGFVFLIISLMFDGKFRLIGVLLIIIMWRFWVFLLMNKIFLLIVFLFKLYGV